jgi:16S rRNA processing protein RimM
LFNDTRYANAQNALAFLFMEIDSCFKIGWILKPHGLKGEVTVVLENEAPADLSQLESVFVEQNQRLVPYFIESVSAQDKKAYVKFEDVDSVDAAAQIAKKSIYIEKSSRPKSGRGEFYSDEVINFEVYDQVQGFLGEIKEIMAAGPNRLLVVSKNEKEILVPINGPFIISVNKSKKTVRVDLPEGFLDI